MQVPGRLEVITGPMFSGKSEELMRRLRRAEIARLRVITFAPELDSRSGGRAIASHNAQRREAVVVRDAAALTRALGSVTDGAQDGHGVVIGIDEAQFFDAGLVGAVEAEIAQGRRVLVAGLDMTFAGEPFGPIPQLMAIADEVTKLSAVCTVCGAPAVHSQRLSFEDTVVLVGAQEAYEARCRLHFSPCPGMG